MHIELNSLGFLKSVAHVKVPSEGVWDISKQIQAIWSIKSAIFPFISPLINVGKNTNQSIEKAVSKKFYSRAHF